MEKILRDWKLSLPESERYWGDAVSSPEFDDSNWCDASVPGTVVGHLADAGVYKDPYYGLNMKEIAGYKHGVETHFAFHPMPQDSPFRNSFWYRTTVEVDGNKSRDQRFWLKFDGLNYKADIWVNGKRVASSAFCSGSYRRYDIEITRWVKRYRPNVIAVELTAQRPDELGITFIDWSPVPPDDSAGIWQPVTFYSTGKVALKECWIDPKLNENRDEANLQVSAKLVNEGKEAFEGVLRFHFAGKEFEAEQHLAPYEEKIVTYSAQNFTELLVKNPELWWPHDMGEQPLYDIDFTLLDSDGEVSDTQNESFGIRTITSEINEHGSREFAVNGKKILIRGSAWSPDLLLRHDDHRDEVDINYLKQMHFNTVRLEGKLASDHFWKLCDEQGMLVLAGWECCTHWEQWDKWKPDDYLVAQESLRSQIIRLRNHASFTGWFYGSDYPPIPPVEKIYLAILEEYAPNLVRVSSAAAFPSTITGDSGVKMSGPYGYVPPSYWYNKEMPGVGVSFNTETGPDASFPRYETVCKMLPEDQQFVGSEAWNHHAGLASFLDTDVMNEAIETRFGVSRTDFKEFLTVSQIISYECWRAMYESYNRNYPVGTGVIGWMQNGHWPSLLWQMYDYWFFPTGGFWGSRVACRPLHVQYSYDDDSVWVINNDVHNGFEGEVFITIYDEKSALLSEELLSVSLAPYERKKVSTPKLPAKDLFFLALSLKSEEGEEVGRNFYWLSQTKDQFEAESTKTTWFYRPLTQASDFFGVTTLPATEISSFADFEEVEDETLVRVHIKNGEKIAFGVQLDLTTSEGELIAPIYWDDNLLFLLPNEERVITATVDKKDYSGEFSLLVTPLNK